MENIEKNTLITIDLYNVLDKCDLLTFKCNRL